MNIEQIKEKIAALKRGLREDRSPDVRSHPAILELIGEVKLKWVTDAEGTHQESYEVEGWIDKLVALLDVPEAPPVAKEPEPQPIPEPEPRPEIKSKKKKGK